MGGMSRRVGGDKILEGRTKLVSVRKPQITIVLCSGIVLIQFTG